MSSDDVQNEKINALKEDLREHKKKYDADLKEIYMRVNCIDDKVVKTNSDLIDRMAQGFADVTKKINDSDLQNRKETNKFLISLVMFFVLTIGGIIVTNSITSTLYNQQKTTQSP